MTNLKLKKSKITAIPPTELAFAESTDIDPAIIFVHASPIPPAHDTDLRRAELFPPEITAAAQQSENDTGCPAAVTLAQYALESGYGKYDLGCYNFFGIKWAPCCGLPYVIMHTKEWNGAHFVPVEAKFIKFPNALAAFDYHGKLLMNPRGPYAVAVPYANDWMKFAQRIAPIYATDPHYYATLVELIEQWRLYEFGSVAPAA